MIPEHIAYNNLKLLSQYSPEELVADEKGKLSKRPQTKSTERQAPELWLGRGIKRVVTKPIEDELLRKAIKETFLSAQKHEVGHPKHPWLERLGVSKKYENLTALFSKIQQYVPELPDMELTPVTKSPPRQFSFNGELFDADLTSLSLESGVFQHILEDLTELDGPIPLLMLDPSLSLEQVKQFFSYLEGEPLPSSLSEQELLTYLIAADAMDAKPLMEKLEMGFLNKCSSSSLLKLALEKEHLFFDLMRRCPFDQESPLLNLLRDLKQPLDVVVSGEPLQVQLKEGKLCRVNGDELQNPLSQCAIVLINLSRIDLESLGTVKEIRDFLGDNAALLKKADLSRLDTLTKSELEDFLNRCPNLEYLELPEHIAGDVLTYLSSVPNLKSLNLSGCTKLNPDSLYNLRHVPHLESLHINLCTNLNRNALENLQYVPNLRHLIAAGCNLDPNALDHLQYVSHLETLNINGCKFAPNALDNLKHVKNLLNLKIRGCINLNPDALDNLRHTQQLETLDMGHCTQFTSLKPLANTPNLKKLYIRSCNGLLPDTLRSLRGTLNLEVLELSFCDQFMSSHLNDLQYNPKLRVLMVINCTGIKATISPQILAQLPKTRVVGLD